MDVASALLTFIHAARRIYEYVHEGINAKEEQAGILDSVEAIQTLLTLLSTRESDARRNPNDPWYQGLLALCSSATTTSNGRALIPASNGQGDGALDRLAKLFSALENELKPKHGLLGVKQRWLWAHDKKTINDALTELDRLRSLIDSVLQQDHFKLSQDTNNRVQSLQRAVAVTASHLQELHTRGSENSGRLISLVDTNADIKSNVEEIKVTADDTNERVKRLEAEGTRRVLEEERKAIINWLSPLQYRRRQSEIFDNAIPLGETFLDSAEFKAWSAGRSWWLYGYGLPGSGKTVLSSIVVDQLQKRFTAARIPVLCIYLNYKEPHQTLACIIGSLLKQLVQFEDDDFKSVEIRRLFREAAREAPPLLSDLYKALQAEIMTFSRVILVVDALDEASASIETQLLDKLHELPIDKLSVMVTSRPRDDIFRYYPICQNCHETPLRMYHYCDICDGGLFELCQDCVDKGIYCHDRAHEMLEPSEVSIDIEPTDADINHYIEHEMKRELQLGSRSIHNRKLTSSKRGTTKLGRICRDAPELQKMIPEYILASCNGMFMMAKLYMSAIKVKTSPEEVKDALEHLPQGYDDSYKATMERIEATSLSNPNDTSSSLAKRALMWVACSYRPLSLAELQEALAIDLDKPGAKSSYRYDKETLLEITAGLLYVNGDESSVNLCHSTALEYFSKNQETWFPGATSKITRCCLQYLSRPELAEPCQGLREEEEFEKRKIQYPFLAYAYLYWGNHAYNAGSDIEVQDAVIQYLEDTLKVDSFIQAAWYLNSSGSASWDVRKGAHSLHVAAWFGLTDAIIHLLKQEVDVDLQDPADGLTPLMMACRRGYAETVKLLLDKGASVNIRNHSESTALFEAVIANRTDVVAVLLTNPRIDINEEHLHNSERTPLMFAAKDDYIAILRELLHNPRIDVNKKDLEGNTALSIAAKAGHSESLRLLLENNKIEVDSVDQNQSTALIHAARNGWDYIVDQLLNKGADVSIKDQDGGTAILRAIDNGHTAVVERMLGNVNVDIHESDNTQRTFLHGAAVNGHAEIIKLLIEKGLNKDAQDDKGRTPLHDASRNGKAEAVSMLLTMFANPTLKDNHNRSPWDVAWLNIQPQILLILEEKLSDPPSVESLLANYPNLTFLPIWSLARLGDLPTLVSALKNHPQSLYHLDPDTDNTALHTAILASQSSLLAPLLDAGLSPNTSNSQFRTPLHLAVLLGSLPCTRILLTYPHKSPLNLNLPDAFHQNPLLIAQITSQIEIALMLVEAGSHVDPHVIQIQSLFFAAVQFAKPAAVKRLIECGAIVVEKNPAGKTALGLANEGLAGLGETDGEGEQKRMGEVITILKENKSRYFKISELKDKEKGEVDGDDQAFQMSAFRRKDIFDGEDEEAEVRIMGIEQVEEGSKREAVLA
ncbi:MAG: hypothetical protein Q9170_007731 [Blastenia crenularia]